MLQLEELTGTVKLLVLPLVDFESQVLIAAAVGDLAVAGLARCLTAAGSSGTAAVVLLAGLGSPVESSLAELVSSD